MKQFWINEKQPDVWYSEPMAGCTHVIEASEILAAIVKIRNQKYDGDILHAVDELIELTKHLKQEGEE